MIDIKKILREEIEKILSESPDYIIVQLYDLNLLNHLTEGQWRPSGIKDYWVRKDTKHTPEGQLHAHIAHQKHIKAKTEQVTWNADGTKHDKKTFNNNFNGITTAKDIARKALNLPADFQLENINYSKGQLLIESFDPYPDLDLVYIFENKTAGEKTVI